MAKAILADYSYYCGKGYLDTRTYYDYWEEVIEIGWQIFSEFSLISRAQISTELSKLHEKI